jgi:hypothetical protein
MGKTCNHGMICFFEGVRVSFCRPAPRPLAPYLYAKEPNRNRPLFDIVRSTLGLGRAPSRCRCALLADN